MKSFSDIISPDQLLNLIDKSADPFDEWNKVQLLASLRLIHFFFGHEWYNLVFRRIEGTELFSDHRYRRYLKSRNENIHPLNDAFWQGEHIGLMQVIFLGVALKVLGTEMTESGLLGKLDELRSSSFAKTFFELDVALIYALKGFQVRFIRPIKGLKTPDLAISKDAIQAVVECKKREGKNSTDQPTRISGVLDRLQDAYAQIRASSQPGIIWIGVENNLGAANPDRIAYAESIQAELHHMPQVCCVMLTSQMVHESDKWYFLSHQITGIPNLDCHSQIPQYLWCNPNHLKRSSIPEVFSYPDAPTRPVASPQ